MATDRRHSGWLRRNVVVGLVLFPMLSACTAVVGGGVAAAVIAIGAITSRCYDYLDVSVFDAQGRKTCAATVTASDGHNEFELTSCYYAPLSDGHWTLRASLPGYPDAVSSVEVEHAHDCVRYVQSVELTLKPARGATPPATAPSAPNAPATPSAPITLPDPNKIAPAPTSSGAVPPPPPSPAPPASAAPLPSGTPEPVPAASGGAVPPVGSFPDQTTPPR